MENRSWKVPSWPVFYFSSNSFILILFFCSIELETAMNVLLLLWLCGNLFVQYSQGYVGQRCYVHWWDCQINEVCDFDPWGNGTCKCDRYRYREVGRGRRKHCAHTWDDCVYDEDCSSSGDLKCVVVNGYHQCVCPALYNMRGYTRDPECVLDKGACAGIGVAVLAAILIVWGVVKMFKGRERQSLSPQPQQQPQQQPHELSPQPQQHDDEQAPNDGGETQHVYKNSGFSGLSGAPPDYKTLFPDKS